MIKNYERNGILTRKDLVIPTEAQLEKGVAITECVQEIPCNPCVDSCPVQAITMKDINAPPVVDYDACIACGNCVGVCPGLAIFVIKTYDEKAEITIPYEFLPLPKKGQKVKAVNREGQIVDTAIVKKVRKKGKTSIITIETKKNHAMDVRHIKIETDSNE